MTDRNLSIFIVISIVAACLISFRYGKNIADIDNKYDIKKIEDKYDSATTYNAVIDARDSVNIIDSTVYLVSVDTIHYLDHITDTTIFIDTAEVLQDYFTRKQYNVSYRDTNIVIDVKPTISYNSLDSVSINYRLLRPIQVNTLAPKAKYEFLIGAQVGQQFAAPNLQVQKDRYYLSVGYNLIQPTWLLGVGYKL